ncbi:hypothetical protein FM105_02955 [Brevibacterium yomogidense]|uniref:Uncharacterized protein n=1 Tax=Brevibacterium yomogidense TaxID=946573 RepID=A0A1X6X0P2_9MICO|nr:hypothetical protein FM105_02955 [Brevibacterium yomogidense]
MGRVVVIVLGIGAHSPTLIAKRSQGTIRCARAANSRPTRTTHPGRSDRPVDHHTATLS